MQEKSPLRRKAALSRVRDPQLEYLRLLTTARRVWSKEQREARFPWLKLWMGERKWFWKQYLSEEHMSSPK